MKTIDESDVRCSRGDTTLLRKIIRATAALAAMRRTIDQPDHWEVLGIQTATPSRDAVVIGGTLAATPAIEALLRRVLDVMKPFAKKEIEIDTPLTSITIYAWLTIKVPLRSVFEESAHYFLELQPESRLREHLSAIDIPASEQEALIAEI
jgi:hypothetical protein